MKAFESTTHSPSQFLLYELSSQLNLDQNTRQLAEQFLNDYRDKDESWDENKSKSVVRCSILAACKSSYTRSGGETIHRPVTISIAALLSGSSAPDLHSFILKLKEFSKVIQLEDQPAGEIQRIINNFAFSLTLYNKFEEVWAALEITGLDEKVKRLKNITWIIYILSRICLLQRRTEIIECACMLLGTLHFVLTMLPDGLSSKAPYKNSGSCIHYLCDLLKAQDEQVTVSASHVGLMVEKFKEHDVIRGDIPNSRCLDGIFSNSHIHYNNSSLELNYQNKLLPDDVDERYFVFKETKIMTPLRNPTSPMIRNGAHRFSAQRILAYEDNDQLSINSRLQDIVFPSIVSNSPYSIKTFPPPTPLSTYIELETWLNSHIENSSLTSIPLEIKHKLDTCAQHILLDLLEEFKQELNETLEKYGIGSIQQSNFIKQNFKSEEENPSKTFKVDNTVKLFYKVLVELLKNDERQQELRESKDNITYVLKNESFYRSLLSCCLETILFVNSETALEFEEVLEICKVSAFDSWKLMKNFTEFDPKIPTPLRIYFKSLELRVISYLAWTDMSPILGLIKQHFGVKEEDMHPAILMFCRRVLSHAALRISDLSNLLGISENLKEEIWNIMKIALSEKTEMFTNRHMDQIIICTIYGVCKAKNLNVTFNALIAKYTELYNDPGKIFRNVRIEGINSHGDIIKFYNEKFVNELKVNLVALSKNTVPLSNRPRIPSLNPSSPLAYSLPLPMISYCPSPNQSANFTRSPLRSPFLTPRSRRYAFGESPSCTLDGINHMMKKTEKHLSFDEDELLGEPIKRPKHVNEIFQDIEEMGDGLPDDFTEN